MKNRIIIMIPARLGSQRLKKKNLEKIGNYSLLELAILKAKQLADPSCIWVNTESDKLGAIAIENGVGFHKRPPQLANNSATSEDFIYEFLDRHECEYIVQLHSIAPLLRVEDIRDFIMYIIDNTPDVLLCYEPIQIECVFGKNPINFSFESKTNSQELEPVKRISWSISAWKKDNFMTAQENKKCATYSGNIEYFPLSGNAALVVKTRDDIELARALYNDDLVFGNYEV